MAPHGRCRWALLLAWLPAGEWGPGLTAPPGPPVRPAPGNPRGARAGTREVPSVSPSVKVARGRGSGGGPAVRGRGGPVRAGTVPPRCSFPPAGLSRARRGAVRRRVSLPKGAADLSPRRKWPPASWQPPVSVVCGQLGWDPRSGHGHGEISSGLSQAHTRAFAAGSAASASWGFLGSLPCCRCWAPAPVGSRSSPPCPQVVFSQQSSPCQALRVP